MTRKIIETDPVESVEHLRETVLSRKQTGAHNKRRGPIKTTSILNATDDIPITFCNCKALVCMCEDTHAARTHREYEKQEEQEEFED